MDLSLYLFVLLTIIFIAAWLGKYRLSIALYVLFLFSSLAVFYHHITAHLPIDL